MTDSRAQQSDVDSRPSHPLRWIARAQGGDPTDPEVPHAKRRRDQRRRQSMIIAATAVLGLAMIALLLLYRMGRQVTDAEAQTRRVDPAQSDRAAVLAAAPGQSSSPEERPKGAPSPALPSAEASSPHRAKPAAAPDIMHSPAF
jgi:hypothetical protein